MKKYFLLGLVLSLSMYAEKKTEPVIFHQNNPVGAQNTRYFEDEPVTVRISPVTTVLLKF
jgi:hypothetical protein